MGNRYQVLEGDAAALLAAMDATEDKDEFRRFQAVYLRLSAGLTVEQIASATCFSVSWVRQLHHQYRHEGLTSLRSKPKGGRYQSRLTVDEEAAILKEVQEEAERGGMLEVSKVHALLQERCGSLSKHTTYRILHRHGWRKVAPRPHHPEADKAARDAFKKNGRHWWIKPE